jgi:hypothetical protein
MTLTSNVLLSVNMILILNEYAEGSLVQQSFDETMIEKRNLTFV